MSILDTWYSSANSKTFLCIQQPLAAQNDQYKLKKTVYEYIKQCWAIHLLVTKFCPGNIKETIATGKEPPNYEMLFRFNQAGWKLHYAVNDFIGKNDS